MPRKSLLCFIISFPFNFSTTNLHRLAIDPIEKKRFDGAAINGVNRSSVD